MGFPWPVPHSWIRENLRNGWWLGVPPFLEPWYQAWQQLMASPGSWAQAQDGQLGGVWPCLALWLSVKHGGYPHDYGVFFAIKCHLNGWWLGVPLFQETTISRNSFHLWLSMCLFISRNSVRKFKLRSKTIMRIDEDWVLSWLQDP